MDGIIHCSEVYKILGQRYNYRVTITLFLLNII